VCVVYAVWQADMIPLVMARKNVLCAADTGSLL